MSSTTTPSAPPSTGGVPARKPASGQAPVSAPSALAALDPMKLLQQYYPWLVAAMIVGTVVGVGSYFGLARTFPRWDAEVTYEVRRLATTATDSIYGAAGSDQDEQDAFMNTQARIMKSDTILSKALEEREVKNTQWAKKYMDAAGELDRPRALRKLRKIVSARVIPDTSIIQLRVGTPSRDDAPNIVNSISDVYMSDAGDRSGKDERDRIEQFEGVVRDLAKDIESIDQRMEALLSAKQLTSLRQESTVAYNEVQNLQPALVKAREEKILTEEQLKGYELQLNNPSGTVYPEAVRDEVERRPIVMERDASVAALKSAIRAQRERFGENHREVRLLLERLAAEQAERDKLVEDLMREAFMTVIENLRNSVRNLTANVEQAETRLAAAKTTLEDVTDALKDYENFAAERSEKLAKKAEMEKNVADARLLLQRGVRVRVLSRGEIPDEMAFPKLIPMTAIGVILVLGATVGIIALREIREQRVRGPHDIALIPRTRVLGVVPDVSMDPSQPERVETAVRDRPTGAIAESIRQLRISLCKETAGRGLKSVMVVSGLPGSGATTIISNLAANMAAVDMRVLVIDANLRRPSLHGLLGAPDKPGLADLLMGGVTFEDAVRTTSVANVWLLPCGRRDVPVFERFTTPAMAGIMRQAREKFDMVLVDATPAVVAGDAASLATHCDSVVLVVRTFAEKRGLIVRLRNQLSDSGAEFLGVVVNGLRASAGGYFKRNFQVTHAYGRERGEGAEGRRNAKERAKEKAAGEAASDNGSAST
ncbi:MAG: AAA family ATPase [Planctomycetota bacterium]|nr:AAA family ATPase [Planctomycetota bacterium]